MKTLLATVILSTLAAGTALAQTAPDSAPTPSPTPVECNSPCRTTPNLAPVAGDTNYQSAPSLTSGATPADASTDDDTGWHRPAGQRFTSGFRLGWMYLSNYDAINRKDDKGEMTSLKKEFGLKSPNMFLIGYEGFYRIVGHSWLNVLMVGNVSVAGLDQSKFIPTASGLLGFEIQRSFELGVGVNLTPDPEAPSHMIIAAGWTPRVGSIQTPIHAFWIPDSGGTDEMGNSLRGNSRYGATIGMNW